MLNQTDLARGHSGHSIPIDLRIDDNSFLLRWQKGRRAIWRATAHHLQAEGAPSPPFQVLPLRVVVLRPPHRRYASCPSLTLPHALYVTMTPFAALFIFAFLLLCFPSSHSTGVVFPYISRHTPHLQAYLSPPGLDHGGHLGGLDRM